MPELAEVAYYCGCWAPGKGAPIKDVRINSNVRCVWGLDTKSLIEQLLGRALLSWRTHGKRMLFEFESDLWLGAHLGMTGSLAIRILDESLEKHDHLALYTDAGWLVFNDPRQFGKLESYNCPDVPEFWLKLPPEPMVPEFTPDHFASILKRRSKTPLKSLLLIQDLFPGVGNWMADEILWKARIRPDRNAHSLDPREAKELYRSIRFVCRGALKHIAPNYSDPPRTWLFQHRWKPGGICPRAKEPLERIEVGGRTTCWSPVWQA